MYNYVAIALEANGKLAGKGYNNGSYGNIKFYMKF